MPWTKERLEEVARTRVGDAKLVVVANREPYIHFHDGDEVRFSRPASGMATALDPVMQACRGVWVRTAPATPTAKPATSAAASPSRRKTLRIPSAASG